MADLVGVPVEVSGGGLRFPNGLPPPKGGAADPSVPHAPRRNNPLSEAQERLALRNALRYFAPEHHAALAPEFASELRITGHIYVHRLRPDAPRKALPLESYPGECEQARCIMLMIDNNLDPSVAQYVVLNPKTLNPKP